MPLRLSSPHIWNSIPLENRSKPFDTNHILKHSTSNRLLSSNFTVAVLPPGDYPRLWFCFLQTMCALYICVLLLVRERSALSDPYSQTTWNSVAVSVCLYVRTVFQNASSPAFLVRLSWHFNTMVPYLGKIILVILVHGFLIRVLWRH